MDDLFPQAAEETKRILQSEYNLAGCLIKDSRAAIGMIRTIVSVDDFRNETCRAIYAAALDLISSGRDCDIGILEARATELGYRIDIDCAAEIQRCFSTLNNAPAHAEIVHEAALKLRASEIGAQLAQGELTALESIGKLQEILNHARLTVKTPLEAVNDFTDYLFSEDAKPPFLSTGYHKLDEILSGGIMAGGLYCLAARTNVGKSNAALNIAQRVAASGKTVLYLSLEMTSNEILARISGIISGMNVAEITARRFRGDEAKELRVMETMNAISGMPLMIYDKPVTLPDIERLIRSTDRLNLAVIDHIGLVREENAAQNSNRYAFMTNITHRLKQIALSTEIPILAICQLNRENEKRQDKVPQLSDLRDSGAIEEDSDAVILLYRESLYLSEENRPKPWEADNMEFLVRKNRHGALGSVTYQFFGINSRIVERTDYR